MYTVKVYEPKQKKEHNSKLVAVHKYPTREEAENAAFALRNFPRNKYHDYYLDTKEMVCKQNHSSNVKFGYKTIVID